MENEKREAALDALDRSVELANIAEKALANGASLDCPEIKAFQDSIVEANKALAEITIHPAEKAQMEVFVEKLNAETNNLQKQHRSIRRLEGVMQGCIWCFRIMTPLLVLFSLYQLFTTDNPIYILTSLIYAGVATFAWRADITFGAEKRTPLS